MAQTKGPTNSDWARVSSTGGIPNASNFQDNDGQMPLCDPHGRQYVIAVPAGTDPDINPIQVVQTFTGGALVTQQSIYNGQCQLISLVGYNSHSTDMLFLQIYDLDVGSMPITGASINLRCIVPVPGGKTPFSFSLPITFTNGIAIALSTTEVTFTAPGAHYLSFTCLNYGAL